MQNPEDCAIKEELANAEELMQQSLGHLDPAKLFLAPQSGLRNTMANYVGPLKVINIPGRFAHVSTSYRNLQMTGWYILYVC